MVDRVDDVGAVRRPVVRLLDVVTLSVGDEEVRLSGLERGLLARVAMGSMVTGAAAEPWLWGEDAPSSAANRIQALVSGIRRKCPVPIVVTAAGGYRIVDEADVDVHRLHVLQRSARALAAAGDAAAPGVFREAIALFGDAPLGAIPATAEVEIERDRLGAERLALWQELIETALTSGRGDLVLGDLAVLTTQHPLREDLVAQHMLALAASGQQSQALELYRRTYRLLDDELGVGPSARLQQAHARVLQGETTAPGVPSAGRDDPPPLDPSLGRAAAPGAVPRTLPRRPPGFAGRERELDMIHAAARRAEDEPVVVQLSGLVGMGTSTLAIEAGQRLRDEFADGTLYLDTGRSESESGVDQALGGFLRLLGVHPDAVPDEPGERAAAYRSLLDGRRILVVIDGIERAAENDLSALLPASAGSMALVVSRDDADWLVPDVQVRVGPMDVADGTMLLRESLGEERIETDESAAAELVTMLGGSPLALRLAAARARQRPDHGLEEVGRRLVAGAREGGDPRTAALTASLRHVWNGLPGPARHAASLLATLPTRTVSGWVLGALLGDPGEGEAAMDALVTAHLVEPVERTGRSAQYRLHDVVSQFVLDPGRLPEQDATAAATRVATALFDRASHHAPAHPNQLVPPPEPGRSWTGTEAASDTATGTGPAPPSASDRRRSVRFFATENELARALARRLANERPDLSWRLLAVTAGAHLFSPSEGDWLSAAQIVADRLGQDDDGRLGSAQLMVCRAWHLQSRASWSGTAQRLAEQARRQLVLLGEHDVAAAAGIIGALAALSVGRREDAERHIESAEAALTDGRHDVLAGWTCIVRGTIHNDYDELADAAREFTRARQVLAGTAARSAFGQATLELSRACRRQGELGSASLLIDEALDHLDGDAEAHVRSYALDARAEVTVELGRGDEALEQAEQAWQRAVRARDAFLTARSRRTKARALSLLGRREEAERELRTSVDEFTVLERSLSAAASLRVLADVLALDGRASDAAEAERQERRARRAARLERPADGAGSRGGAGSPRAEPAPPRAGDS